MDTFFTAGGINPEELSVTKQEIQRALTECKRQLSGGQNSPLKQQGFEQDREMKTFLRTELSHLK